MPAGCAGISPPLTVKDEEIDDGLGLLNRAVAAVVEA